MKQVVAVVLVVSVLAGLVAGYLIGNSNRLNSTVTSTTVGTTTVTLGISTSTTVISTVASTITQETPIPIASVETGNVSIGAPWNTIAVNPEANRIYVAGGSNVLTVIDAVSHAVVAMVTLPADFNSGIAIDNRTGMVYVLVQGGVAEINDTTNTVVGELPISFGFRSIVYDSSTGTLYGSPGSGYLIGVDARTGAVTANISIGYWMSDILVNSRANLIYAIGCEQEVLFCGSVISVVNGTNSKLVNETYLGSESYATATINQETGLVYVSDVAQLVVMNSLGAVIYNNYPDTCGPFIAMAADPLSNQVILAPQNYNYLLVYDGEYGNLVNMYSLPNAPQYVAFDSNTNETYVIVGDSLIAFHGAASSGHVNSTLIGADQTCLLV